NELQTNFSGRAELYINSYNSRVLTGCYIELEMWDETAGGKLEDDFVACTSHFQIGTTYTNCTGHSKHVHADAYLHAANGGFRVGPSTSVFWSSVGCT